MKPPVHSLVRSKLTWNRMPNSLEESEVEQPLEMVADSASEIKPKSGWMKWLRRIAVGLLVFVGLCALTIFILLELAKVEPEFYRQLMQADQQLQKRNGSEMERKILDLRNSVMISDAWSATFTQDEINGWFAYDLKEKFPDLIPPEVIDPRLVTKEESLTLAFRCIAKPFRGIAIIEADVFMTGVVNQVGIRIKSVHSGKIPLPLAAFAVQISTQLGKSGIEIEWNTEEDDPIAILQLPDALVKPDSGGYIELQEIKISTGEVSLLGITHPPDF